MCIYIYIYYNCNIYIHVYKLYNEHDNNNIHNHSDRCLEECIARSRRGSPVRLPHLTRGSAPSATSRSARARSRCTLPHRSTAATGSMRSTCWIRMSAGSLLWAACQPSWAAALWAPNIRRRRRLSAARSCTEQQAWAASRRRRRHHRRRRRRRRRLCRCPMPLLLLVQQQLQPLPWVLRQVPTGSSHYRPQQIKTFNK